MFERSAFEQGGQVPASSRNSGTAQPRDFRKEPTAAFSYARGLNRGVQPSLLGGQATQEHVHVLVVESVRMIDLMLAA
jgi:hypothetical protein